MTGLGVAEPPPQRAKQASLGVANGQTLTQVFFFF
jgi:hypothetical protein